MIAVLFEATAVAEQTARYFQLAEQLKPLLGGIDGFISIERFQSTTNPDKFISLSWWENEEAIKYWKSNVHHQLAQNEGKSSIFASYKINVLTSTREYQSQ
ncbi:antibiotic biosynthesis monooxygenase family protein [Vibrio viridaestus]|uniref:Antibiotic biosynthesis monooxygenase n=1 Tax=Vibrio viridaestus TaxID=2487322 RepID=A0A3N9TJX2_9VIBR|nr:antibiotic biosynthesis monooxygenase [Vibrio viridaestus]RQW64688.1 antibiotic biosynthesis monooxygenase [Vibrio viridaestus]